MLRTCVVAPRDLGERSMEKLEPKFEKGVWLGVCSRTDEAIIRSAGGIVRAGKVQRQAIEEAWNSTAL